MRYFTLTLKFVSYILARIVGRKDLLTPKTTGKAQVLPLKARHNRTLPNVKQIIRNHWPILKTLEKTFSVEPIIAFRKRKSLKQLIGEKTI